MHDTVVIGAGLAGLTCANRLCELGRQVLVLEQGDAADYPCNSRYSGGIVHVAFKDMRASREDIQAVIARLSEGDGAADAIALSSVLAEEGGRALEWMQSHGAKFVKGGALEFMRWILAPPRPRRPGLDWKGRGPDVLLRRLTERLREQGGELLLDHRVLGGEGGRGAPFRLRVSTSGDMVELKCRQLVVADGGFQGDDELVRAHISGQPGALFPRGAATGKGDGLRLAQSLGADTLGLNRFYGHLLGRDVFENETLWPYPTVDAIAQSALLVDAHGRRFVDEGLGGVLMANEVARLPDPLGAVAVFDEAIWTGVAADNRYPPCMNPSFVSSGGEVFEASDLPSLASVLGMEGSVLTDTVSEYNRAVLADTTLSLSPPRRRSLTGPQALETPPFRAIRVCAGMTYTMGGIRVDGRSRVLDAACEQLPGLYAVGAAAGGMEGGENAIYLGGLAKAVVTGLRAAETIGGEA